MPKGSYGNTAFYRRRVLKRFWERVLRRVLGRGPAMGFTVKRGSEKGSQKRMGF